MEKWEGMLKIVLISKLIRLNWNEISNFFPRDSKLRRFDDMKISKFPINKIFF